MSNINDISTWLTLSEAARAVERSAGTIHYHLAKGRVRFVSTPHGRLIDPEDLQRLKRRLRARGREEQR
jgi:predicted site-specific integrase-resolvase